MNDDYEAKLAAIFAEAELLGIDLTPKPERVPVTKGDRLAESFEEILRFVDEHGREPVKCMVMNERKLAIRLAELRMNPTNAAKVRRLDRHGLLPPAPESLEEVLGSAGGAALLDEAAADIFDLSALPKREKPEYIARRKPCKDFQQFKELFEQCQVELWNGKRHTSRVADGEENRLEKGWFVLVKGMLGYIAEKGEITYNKRNEPNCRLRVIFENGTESDLLMRSLFTALYDDGRMISLPDEDDISLEPMVSEDDLPSGYIYVLKSLSEDPQIKAIPNLYKIGLTTGNVEDRIANASNEPTYLMSEVQPVQVWHCYNLDVCKLEHLIHTFFKAVCVDIEIHDGAGRLCRPREWFSVPFGILERVVPKMIDGSIIKYRYDHERQTLEEL